MECAYHPGKEPIGTCHECGKFVCLECRNLFDGKIFCPSCSDKLFPIEEQLSFLSPLVQEQQKKEPPTPVDADGIKTINQTCPSCGNRIVPDDIFCAHCGCSLNPKVTRNQYSASTSTKKSQIQASIPNNEAKSPVNNPLVKPVNRSKYLPAGLSSPLQLTSLFIGLLMLVSIFFLAWLDFAGLTLGIFELLGIFSILFIAGSFTLIASIFLKRHKLRGLLHVITGIVELLLCIAIIFWILIPLAEFAPSAFSLTGPGFWLFLATVIAALVTGVMQILNVPGIRRNYNT